MEKLHGTVPRSFARRHDIPLNENGRAQARLVAGALSNVRIEAAYTSPLSYEKTLQDSFTIQAF